MKLFTKHRVSYQNRSWSQTGWSLRSRPAACWLYTLRKLPDPHEPRLSHTCNGKEHCHLPRAQNPFSPAAVQRELCKCCPHLLFPSLFSSPQLVFSPLLHILLNVRITRKEKISREAAKAHFYNRPPRTISRMASSVLSSPAWFSKLSKWPGRRESWPHLSSSRLRSCLLPTRPSLGLSSGFEAGSFRTEPLRLQPQPD